MVRWQVKAQAYTQAETPTKLSKSNDITLKQPVLITLPILLMAWMRSFLSENRQSLLTHSLTQQCWRSSGSSFNTVYRHTSSSKHRLRDSLCSGMPFGASLENTSSFKTYLFGAAMPSGVTWMNIISGLFLCT